MKNEIFIDKPESYFYPKIIEEEMPIAISPELNKKYYNIESIYNTFYTKNSISIEKIRYSEECNSCHVKNACSGMFYSIKLLGLFDVHPIQEG